MHFGGPLGLWGSVRGYHCRRGLQGGYGAMGICCEVESVEVEKYSHDVAVL